MEDPECEESDPEEEGWPDNDLTQKGAAGEKGEKKVAEEKEDEEGEESGTDEEQQEKITVEEEDWYTCSEDGEEEGAVGSSNKPSFYNSSRLLHKDELLDMFKAVHNGPRCKEGQLTVGLVGKT